MPVKKIKALLLENIHDDAAAKLRKKGFAVETLAYAPGEKELRRKLRGVTLLGVRSRAPVTASVLGKADDLSAVGSFCIGTSNIDLEACTAKGIAVFNAPYSNTRSVAELVIGETIMLMRGIFEKSRMLGAGTWNKSAANAYEIRGKRLGIIGYGSVGGQVGILAEALGMEVLYHDLLEKLNIGNAKKCRSMGELLRRSDVVTMHVDDSPRNAGLMGERQFRAMRKGSIFINTSRGRVVDLSALARNVKNGKIAGAAIDVFPKEPEMNTSGYRTGLEGIPNVIVTPHIAGSTHEAQKNIASYVPDMLLNYMETGNSFYSVNFPRLRPPALRKSHRLLHIHRNVPGVMSQITSIFAAGGINITGQYLGTNEQIGYAIMDVAKKHDRNVVEALRSVPETIRLRVLF